MIEYKFRLWDKVLKCWVFKGLDFYQIFSEIEKDCIYAELNTNELKKRWIFTQYVGQKDKNGKEIYEGDIIQTECGTRGVVEYSEERLKFDFNCHDPMGCHYIYCMVGDKEIVGNIFENPDLLPNNIEK